MLLVFQRWKNRQWNCHCQLNFFILSPLGNENICRLQNWIAKRMAMFNLLDKNLFELFSSELCRPQLFTIGLYDAISVKLVSQQGAFDKFTKKEEFPRLMPCWKKLLQSCYGKKSYLPSWERKHFIWRLQAWILFLATEHFSFYRECSKSYCEYKLRL